MMQKVDLYSLLWAYANKVHSPTIKISVFIDFIGKYARQHEAAEPEWKVWTQNALSKFWEEVPALVDAGKCMIQGIAADRFIFLTQYYVAMIALAYKVENSSSLAPFPDERGLKIQIPDEQITVLRLKEDLADYLDKTEATHTSIINLDVSKQMGSILVLDSMIPHGLLEVAFLKIRFYLMIPGKRDLALQKLLLQFHEQEEEGYPQNILDSLIERSNTLIKTFEECGDSSYLFWVHLCSFIRHELDNKTPKSPEDTTLLQTLALIEQFNLFFNAKANQRKIKEKAFEELTSHLTRPPYLYNTGDIIKFVGHDGKPLLEYYSSKELDEFLAEKTMSPPDHVPELVAITDAKKEQWFVSKAAFPLVCVQQLHDAHAAIHSAIIEHWLKLLQHYETEPAMEDDRQFRDTLIQYLRIQTPTLAAMLEYKRISLLFSEMQSAQNGYTEFAKLFDKQTGKMLGLNEILLVKRRTLLSDAYSSLPFWYSIPLFVKLVRLFRKKNGSKTPPDPAPSATLKKEKPLTFLMVCTQFEEALVPPGQTLDGYLTKLWDRWAKLIKDEDRKNLREDVNSLVRDRIRRTARLLKPVQITENYLSQTASELIQTSPALRQLQNNSLELYIKLYLIKLMMNIPR